MRHNQNRRSRGRSRKGPNPLTRSYESNGPDVKVRGTAAHVAEKYMSLARDAISSGDIVAAENYLQHAEHYNRIVAAAQIQLQQTQPQQFREGEDGDEDGAINGRGRDRFGYYSDPEGDEGGDDRFDSNPVEDDGDRAPQRQAQRPDYRQGRNDGRDGGQPNRYAGDRGRNSGPNRDHRDGRDQRGDYRGDRYGGDRPRQDYRDNRNDAGPERYAGDRQRNSAPGPDARDRDNRTDGPAERFGGPVEPREDRDTRPGPAAGSPAPDTARSEPGQTMTERLPDSGAEEEALARPRKRRSPRLAANGADPGAAESDGTRDGEAALAAFPE